jgi:hypothetical protein
MDINGELLKRIKDLEKRLDALSGQEVLTMTALTDLTDGGATTLHTHTGEVTNGNNHDHSGGDGAQINHTTLSNIGTTTHAQIDTFISNATATLTDGWWTRSETWTRTSNTTFTVSGDLTAVFVPGTKIKVTQTSTKYFYVVSSSYSSPSTTVTITGGSDYSLTANPSARWISYQANPQGFPQWFNYAPTWGGFSSAPTVAAAVFCIVGRMVTVVVNCSGNGTSNATTLTCTLPIAAAYAGRGAAGYAVNNGSVLTVAGRIYVVAASNTMYAYTDMETGAWTNSGAKRLDFCLTYGI